MRQSIIAIALILCTGSAVLSQELIETKLAETPPGIVADVYGIVFDRKSGRLCRLKWNNDNTRVSVVDNERTSEEANYISPMHVRFLSGGKYVAFGDNYGSDTNPSNTILIVDGQTVMKSDFIDWTTSYVNSNDEVVFPRKQGDNYYLTKYSEQRGVEDSGPFDEIRAAFRISPDANMEGDEYVREENLFRDKEGNRVFIALKNGKAFILTENNTIPTPYSDIDYSSLCYDNNGELCFIAKEKGKLFEPGRGCFVVRGDKKMSEFDFAYPPIYFDRQNNMYYMIADSAGEYVYNYDIAKNSKRLNSGNRESKTYNSGISDVKFDDNGDLMYVASGTEKNEYESSDYMPLSYLIEKNGRHFLGYSIRPIQWGSRNEALFAAQETLNARNTDLYLWKNGSKTKINSKRYDDIYGYGYTRSGGIYYMGLISDTTGGTYKSSTDFVMDGKKIGTYSFLSYQSLGDSVYPMAYSPSGDFTFVAEEQLNDTTYGNAVFTNGVKLPFPETAAGGPGYFRGVYNLFYTVSGEMFFIAVTKPGEDYTMDLKEVFVNNRSLGKIYNSVGAISYDPSANEVSFIATRGNEVFDVKLKF